MERYKAYKDTGIEWIGDIPADWTCANLGAIAKQRKNLNKNGEVNNVLSLSYGRVRRRVLDNTGLLPESFNTYNVIEDGDVVLRLTDLQNDQRSLRVGLCLEQGIITAAYTTLEPQSIDSRYLFYSLAVFDYWKGFYGLAGGVRQSLTFDGIRSLRFPLPDRIEQQAIASYLDAKTAEIDSLVSDCEHEVELLREYRRSVISEAVTRGLDPNVPMRDSGVEWIGEIPEHWLCSSLSRAIETIQTGPFGSQLHAEDYSDDGDVCVVNPANIMGGKIHPSTCKRISKGLASSLSHHLMRKGEIVFGRRGEMGRCALVEEDGLFCGTGSIEMKLLETVVPAFAVYYLQCDFVKSYLELQSVGTTLQNLNTRIIATTPFVVAPVEEQEAIVTYLDAKTAEIDSLIEDRQSMADKLREFRKSLISEAVTGKFKVPGV